MSDYYPPVAFSFSVSIGGTTQGVDASFAEVSGLQSEISVEDVREGGENRFVHRLPGRAAHGNVELKRGLMLASSKLTTWCKDTIEGGLSRPIAPKTVVISLLDQQQAPTASWTLTGAWPVKWSVGPLDAQENSVAVESIDLACNTITRKVHRTLRKTGTFQP